MLLQRCGNSSGRSAAAAAAAACVVQQAAAQQAAAPATAQRTPQRRRIFRPAKNEFRRPASAELLEKQSLCYPDIGGV